MKRRYDVHTIYPSLALRARSTHPDSEDTRDLCPPLFHWGDKHGIPVGVQNWVMGDE